MISLTYVWEYLQFDTINDYRGIITAEQRPWLMFASLSGKEKDCKRYASSNFNFLWTKNLRINTPIKYYTIIPPVTCYNVSHSVLPPHQQKYFLDDVVCFSFLGCRASSRSWFVGFLVCRLHILGFLRQPVLSSIWCCDQWNVMPWDVVFCYLQFWT